MTNHDAKVSTQNLGAEQGAAKLHPIHQIICRNLFYLRKRDRYSQQEIAKVLSIKQPSYNWIEAGRTRLNLEDAYVLAKFYNISLNDLFREDLFPLEEPALVRQIDEG